MSPEHKHAEREHHSAATAAEKKRESQKWAPAATTGVLLYLVGGAWYALSKPEWRSFVLRWWWAFGLGTIALLVGLLLPWTRRQLAQANAIKRIGLLIFVLIPVVAGLVLCVVLLPPTYQANAIRLVFLAAVILLPGIMYYLFISTRKFSLLNEFITNLDRLGLLSVPHASIGQSLPDLVLSQRRRFEAYLSKFEALYGPVSEKSLMDALEARREGLGGFLVPRLQAATVPSQRIVGLLASETPLPVAIATLLMALGWILVLPLNRGTSDPVWPMALTPTQGPVHFAFLGAYFFSLQMLFRRYVLRDLRPSAYVAVSMRIVLAVIGTWVVVAAAKSFNPKATESSLIVTGFAIGVFPSVAWQFVQAALKKVTFAGFFMPSLQSQLPISDLDGLTVWHEARLAEEDIENIPNMATADLVELMLQTRFSADRIIDWTDQAILYTHLGPQSEDQGAASPRKQLRTHGIRTASSLVEAYRNVKGDADRDAFEKILAAGNGRSPIRALVDTVETNPNFKTIWVWRGLPMPRVGVRHGRQPQLDTPVESVGNTVGRRD